jgi:hypothetical protein
MLTYAGPQMKRYATWEYLLAAENIAPDVSISHKCYFDIRIGDKHAGIAGLFVTISFFLFFFFPPTKRTQTAIKQEDTPGLGKRTPALLTGVLGCRCPRMPVPPALLTGVLSPVSSFEQSRCPPSAHR